MTATYDLINKFHLKHIKTHTQRKSPSHEKWVILKIVHAPLMDIGMKIVNHLSLYKVKLLEALVNVKYRKTFSSKGDLTLMK